MAGVCDRTGAVGRGSGTAPRQGLVRLWPARISTARISTAPSASRPLNTTASHPAGTILRCGTHACSTCQVASLRPGLPKIRSVPVPPSRSPNQGWASPPRTSARQDRDVTSGRSAARRNRPDWKQIGPYSSVPSTMPAWLAGISSSSGRPEASEGAATAAASSAPRNVARK